MNLFKSFTLKWWQAALFKLSLLALGIVIGATWAEYFFPWRSALLIVFAATAAYVTRVWWKQ